MLQLICGTDRKRRKAKMTDVALQATKLGKFTRHLLWLTPDQYSFEAERDLMHRLSPMTRSQLMVTGFSRFSNQILKQYGGIAVRYADELCKTILMRRASEDCLDQLRLYGKPIRAKDPQFQKELLQFVRQMKFSGLTPRDLQTISYNKKLSESLRAKAADLSALSLHYEARLHAAWRDSLDDLAAATKRLTELEENGTRYFFGMTVFLDGFKSFTAPQYEMIRLMLRQGAEVYVSLDTALVRGKVDSQNIFAVPMRTYHQLIALTNGQYRTFVFQPESPDEPMTMLGQNMFADSLQRMEGLDAEVVSAYLCRDEYAEAEFCFGKIKAMLKDRDSLRLRDIAVVYREESEYQLPIAAAAQKFDLPYCVDGGADAEVQPLFRVAAALLRMAYQRFTAVEALTVMKSGLFSAEATEIAELEEYLRVWGADSYQDWMLPFTSSSVGYEAPGTGEKEKQSDAPERLRNILVNALQHLNTDEKHTAKEFGGMLYAALESLGTVERFSYQVLQQSDLADRMEKKRVWNAFGEILTRLSDTLAEEAIDGKEYCRLFAESVRETRLKAVEQTVDCIMVGSADRIRLHDPKVLWILGANDGVFPKRPNAQAGLFSDRECQTLSELEFGVGKTLEERIAEERYTAYQMVCAPSEALFISCRVVNLGGDKQMPGELIHRVEALLGHSASWGVLSETELMTTPQAAFEAYCDLLRWDKKSAGRYLSLLQRLPNGDYHAAVATANELLRDRKYALTNPDLAQQLYALYQRTVSPSEIEKYFHCPFAYFVEYGLKLKIRERACYNPILRGNMVHQLIAKLTVLISEMAKRDAAAAADSGMVPQKEAAEQTICGMVDQEFDAEIRLRFDQPGRISEKDKALAESMRLMLKRICTNIYAEQLQSKFAVFAVEFDIGNRAVAPLRVPVERGKELRISGKVDRMDAYEQDDTTYFRVIDYKTGNVEFKYANLMHGEQLQMILYQMAIEHGGKGGFSGLVPSGVLYYPAKRLGYLNKQTVSDEEREQHLASGYCMNGFLVDDKEKLLRVRAMEEQLKNYYIPVGLNKKNQLDDAALRSEAEYRSIEKYVLSQVRRMAKSVSAGEITPIYRINGEACEYCGYYGICGKDIRAEIGEREKIDEAQAKQLILQEEEAKWD